MHELFDFLDEVTAAQVDLLNCGCLLTHGIHLLIDGAVCTY
jgi:hypothetical protein